MNMNRIKEILAIFLAHFFVFQPFFVTYTSASDLSNTPSSQRIPLNNTNLYCYNLHTASLNKFNPYNIFSTPIFYPVFSANLVTQELAKSKDAETVKESGSSATSETSAYSDTGTSNTHSNNQIIEDETVLFQDAEADFKAKNWEDAESKYRKFIKAFPNDPRAAGAYLKLANLLEEDPYRYKEVISMLDKAVELTPQTRTAHEAKTIIARFYYQTGKYSQSLDLLREVLHETQDWSMFKYANYLMKIVSLADRQEKKGAMIPSCGTKSLAEVLEIKGKKTPNVVSQKKKVVSLDELKKEAEKNKVNAVGVKLTQIEEAKEIPWIAHLKYNHFVVVTGIDGEQVKIIDSDSGEAVLARAEFQKRWSGYALVFPKKEQEIDKSYLLSAEQMQEVVGGHHLHGGQANYGGPEENPSATYDKGPSRTGGCGKSPGMPNLMLSLAISNLVVQDTDIMYEGRGPTVLIERTYNSDDHTEGIFGRGWTSNYEVSLTEDASKNVGIKGVSGARLHFTLGGGTYNPPRWNYDELGKNADGTFDLWVKNENVTKHFDANGNLVSITDKNGNKVTLQYDSNNRLSSVADAVGRITTFNYGTNGKVESITDPLGRQAFYYYNSNNDLIKTTDMAGNIAEYTYNYTYQNATYMNSIITAKGTTAITYGPFSGDVPIVVTSITDPAGNTKSYDPWYGTSYGDVSACMGGPEHGVTDANGHTTSYFVKGPDGETTAITDILCNKWQRGLDSNGMINSITDPYGNKTTFLRDNRGNITKITDPLGNKVQFTYDTGTNKDNLTGSSDPAGNSYLYEYDANSNLTKITDSVNNITTFAYGSYGELTTLTDARGNTLYFTYDSSGNLSTMTNPVGGKDSYTYDSIGRVVAYNNPKGNTTSYTYDELDRIKRVDYPDGSTKSFTYDCCGLSTVTDSNGTLIFTYYNDNRLEKFIDIYGKTISYDYDAAGNLTSLTYPDGKVVSYKYDAADRLIEVKDWLNNATTYEYDNASRLINVNYPDGSTITHEYDKASRLTSILDYSADATINGVFQYTLDALGNRTEVSYYQPLMATPASQNVSYTYDNDNRLLTAGTTTFSYDNNGNLTSKTVGSSKTSYTPYLNNDMLAQVTTGGKTYSYKYDGLGNRTTRDDTRYVVDPSGALSTILAETDTSGKITAYYVYGLGLVSKITSEGKAYYYHYDGLGSTIAITDSSGNIVNKYAYDAFGSVLKSEEQISNSFKYVGRFGVMDEGNGLLYMRARYYDPGVGRFINKDPIGLLGGLNMYVYGGNNPVNKVDPSGEFVIPYIIRVVATVLLIVGELLFPLTPPEPIQTEDSSEESEVVTEWEGSAGPGNKPTNCPIQQKKRFSEKKNKVKVPPKRPRLKIRTVR